MTVPGVVLAAYGITDHHIKPVTGGLINTTYAVQGKDGQTVFALQCLHPVFVAEVNLDIEALTAHLISQGMVTPTLVRTTNGKAWCEVGGHVWRATRWVDGKCFPKIPDPEVACGGAALVGRFHRAFDGFAYDFQFTRAGVHNTQAHLDKLNKANSDEPEVHDAKPLRDAILAQATQLPPIPALPERICHGDLKISNLLFDDALRGLCLVDLDTMGWQTIAYELGDALRSWANATGEDHSSPSIDKSIVAAVAQGYAEGSAGLLSEAEIDSVIVGLETVCIELAARFCVDAYEDHYFGWDAKRYPSRRAHNLLRAQGQLALGQSVATRRAELQALWRRSFP